MENRVAKSAAARCARLGRSRGLRADAHRRQPEMPQVGEAAALEKQSSATILQQDQTQPQPLGSPRPLWRRIGSDARGREGAAEPPHGTLDAARRSRQADDLAELHECLIPVSRAFSIEKLRRQRRMRLTAPVRPRQAAQPREHADDVAVKRRDGAVEGNREHRRRGVGSDAGKTERSGEVLGERAPAGFEDARRPMKRAGAAVVAESGPERKDLLLLRGGQRLQVGKPAQETLVGGKNDRHPRLLQHDLGDPDAIGIARLPPGQRPGVVVVPGEQGLPKSPRRAMRPLAAGSRGHRSSYIARRADREVGRSMSAP